ncbi:MAG: hypothetical protein COA66_10260 [Arcobacter sp.]|nr:MAG: hypothetical protein COA66_10260 [Arcobacter sp.]
MSDDDKKYRVAQKGFQSKNLLNISAFITVTKNSSSAYPVCKDLVYLEFYNGIRNASGFSYDYNNRISMKMDSYELRRLVHGCKELLRSGKTNYKNYTDPNLTRTSNGYKKTLTLGVKEDPSKGSNYFINMETNAAINISFDVYGFASFCDITNKIAEECESVLYNYQRKMELKVNKDTKAN